MINKQSGLKKRIKPYLWWICTIVLLGQFPAVFAAEPTVTLGLSGSSLAENGGVAIVTATLSNSSTQNVIISLNLTGTATGNGTDYTASGTSITILAGDADNKESITLTGNDDSLNEVDETIIVDINNVDNGTENGLQTVTAIITDDDAVPTVNFSALTQTIGENISTATITAQLFTVAGIDVSVPFTINGASTAISTDYSISNSPLTISAGNTSADITLTISDDNVDEADETVIVNMGTPTNATQGTIITHTATIQDNDVSLVINEIEYENKGADKAEFVELKNISGSAIDFSSTPYTLHFLQDNGTFRKNIDLDSETVANNDYFVICNIDTNVPNCDQDEANTDFLQNSTEAVVLKLGDFIVDKVSYEGDVTGYVEGTAAIEDNETEAFVSISRFPDGTDTNNNNSDFALKCITPGTENKISDSNGCYALSINDPTAVIEGDSGNKTIDFTVSLSHAATQDVTVDYATSDNTATSGSDYTAITATTLTFAAGTNADKTVTVTISGDDIDEDTSEAFFIDLISHSSNAQISDNQGIGTITDDDTAGITLSKLTASVNESGTKDTFTVVLDSEPTSNVEIAVSSSDIGEATVDKASLTFTSGDWDTAQTISVTGVDDDSIDSNQTCIIQIGMSTSGDSDYNNIASINVTVTVQDDNIAGINGADIGGSISIIEGGATGSYDFKLNSQPTGDVEITVTADTQTEISKDGGINFGNSIILTFNNGHWNIDQTIIVQAIDDDNIEGNHTGTISHVITGTVVDKNYPPALTLEYVTINITDNDSPPPSVKPPLTDTSGSTSSQLSDTMIVFTKFGGLGLGTVTSSPSGINCKTEHVECKAEFDTASKVTLTATADSGSEFNYWTGKDCNTEMFLVNNHTCTAYFKLTPRTLTISYSENGIITSSTSGINCGNNNQECNSEFEGGETINLSATANSGYIFDSWSENCANGNIQLLKNTTCSATFALKPIVITPIESSVIPPISEPTIDEPTIIAPTNPSINNIVSFSKQNYEVIENIGNIDITINRSGIVGAVKVDLSSSDDSGKANIHYRQIKKTLFWATGDDTKIMIPVEIIDNIEVDGNKEIILSLGNAENTNLELDTSVLTIIDDDKLPVISMDELATPATTFLPPLANNTCSSGTIINTTCDFNWNVAKDIVIKEKGDISYATIESDINNEGRISNSKITESNKVTGGIFTGYITNFGTLSNFEFVGASITGMNDKGEIIGILSGKIFNNNEIGGSFENIRLAPNTHIIGGILEKTIIGDKEQPAILESLLIKSESIISNVIIGDDVEFEEDVTLDGNVSFSIHTNYMKANDIFQLPALGNTIIFNPRKNKTTISFAILTGGILENNGTFERKTTIKRNSKVIIKSNLLVDVRHIGKQADILVVAVHTINDKDTFYMLNYIGKPISWNGRFSNLMAFQKQVNLAPVEQLDIWDEVLDIEGSVTVYIGYRLTDGRIVYSHTNVIEMDFSE